MDEVRLLESGEMCEVGSTYGEAVPFTFWMFALCSVDGRSVLFNRTRREWNQKIEEAEQLFGEVEGRKGVRC